jgi:ribonuclease BN (tRNA processing enzyme)
VALDRLADGADLLLAEASFRHGDTNPDDLHLTGRDAGEVAARNGVPRLVITHVPPWYDAAEMVAEARTTYDGDATAAVPGASYRLA